MVGIDEDNSQLSESVKVRFTKAEVNKLRELASHSDMTLSAFIRWGLMSWLIISSKRLIDVLKTVDDLVKTDDE